MKANDVAEYDELLADDDTDVKFAASGVQKTLSVYVALLRSNNTLCSLRVFDTLTRLWSRVRLTTAARSPHCQHRQHEVGRNHTFMCIVEHITLHYI